MDITSPVEEFEVVAHEGIVAHGILYDVSYSPTIGQTLYFLTKGEPDSGKVTRSYLTSEEYRWEWVEFDTGEVRETRKCFANRSALVRYRNSLVTK